ncbi:hypothetical protein BDP81DRAFT_495085, partial [Colletotrichum phormii]
LGGGPSPHDLKDVAAAGDLSDKSTKSLAAIKHHVSFTIPDRSGGIYDATSLVGQVYPPASKPWENDQKHNANYTLAFNMILRQRDENRYDDDQTLRRLRVLRAVATSPAAFAKESSAWARTFGDFLFHDKPSGVDDVTFLRELRDQAASRAAGHSQSQPPREYTPEHITEAQASDVHLGASYQQNIDNIFDASRVRQEIWTALCPGRQCVGGYPFEVPVPPIAQLKAHVIDDLEDDNSDKNPGQRLPLANYIHPHVTISLTQRERPDGEAFHTLVLGLTESTSTLRSSRHGLLQAYDMAVCRVSEVDKDGVSYSLRRAFDGCHAVTESFAAGTLRIEEMARLEKQIERLAPQCSQSDMVTERIKEWMERRRYKAQYTSQEAWSATLRKWWGR